ncbi:hypothetical protein AAF712_006306 [Marasmius tenuissimus]|uniref:F-box domain-containing protein n=1 Tax=Marasmius tenuissimus TaxID=585030 RepID=A0ABR2ZYL2_9AGAR
MEQPLCDASWKPSVVHPLRRIDSCVLRTTYTPSEGEASEMTRIMEKEEEDIVRRTKEILWARQMLKEAETRKKALELNLMQRRSIVSVQRRVPAEIWEIIFGMASVSSYRQASLVIDSRIRTGILMPPIILSHVCSRWRQITLRCPRIWSSIHIEFQGLPKHSHHLLRTYLENSRGSVLRLSLSASGTRPDTLCWHILAPNLSRCSSLTLEVYDMNDFVASIRSTAGISLPVLVSFNGMTGQDDAFVSENWLWQAVRHASKLVTAQIPYVLPSSSFCYPQLTKLKVGDLNAAHFTEFLTILKTSSLLRSLSIVISPHDYSVDSIPEVTISKIELPYLQRLVANSPNETVGLHNHLLNTLFRSLTTPSLHNLALRYADTRESSEMRWPPPLLTMVSHSSSSLQSLTLRIDHLRGCPQEPISAILKMTPHVISFQLQMAPNPFGLTSSGEPFHQVTSTFITTFISELMSRPPLLPRLESLSVQVAGISLDRSIIDSVFALAASRGRARAAVDNLPFRVDTRTLKDIRIEPFSPLSGPLVLSEEALARIRQMEDEGIMLHIGHGPKYFTQFDDDSDFE